MKETLDMNNQFHSVFVDELKDLLDAEQQIIAALPKMIQTATHKKLSNALQLHLSQTEDHVVRLEEIFSLLDEKPETKPCKGIRGIIAEGEDMLHEDLGTDVRDAMLIMAAQKVEHYEIATYGTVVTWAKLMEHDEVVGLLAQNLLEEKENDIQLSVLAQNGINEQAAGIPQQHTEM